MALSPSSTPSPPPRHHFEGEVKKLLKFEEKTVVGNRQRIIGQRLNGSLIPESSAHFNRLFETSSCRSSPRATALKQTMQNFVMATVGFSLDNTEQTFADLSRGQLPINFKRLIGLKITLVKFTYPKG